MERAARLLLLLCLVFAGMLSADGQGSQPIPTLAVPTLVPAPASAAADALLSTSALADIQQSGVFRVGILYNAPPYSELTLQGELRGFDAELMRLIAETWAVDIAFSQVTRQNALDMLNRGAVDAVASSFVHYRHWDTELEFTQTYVTGKQAMMVAADSQFEAPTALIQRPIGYVIGTRAELALQFWGKRLGTPLNLRHYFTLDRAFAALTQGEIDGVTAAEQDLLRVSREYAGAVRILEEPVLVEPHGIAVRRQDANMRNLLNRTLQYLAKSGQLEQLFSEFFPSEDFREDAVYLWEEIGEGPNPGQFAADIKYPARYALPRVLGSGFLRVGGLAEAAEEQSAGEARLARLNREMVHKMAERWGVAVQLVFSTPDMAVDLLRQGEVDLIVGLRPDWRLADSVDFAAPYLLHGDRLMVPANSNVSGFHDLRGRWIGVMFDDDRAQARAQAWADSINASVRFYQMPAGDAALALLEWDNADAIYADSLSLISHLEASPGALRLTERWYSRSYYAFGLPYNDIDFRLLVDYTVQELIIDGTLKGLSADLILSDELPHFDILPGASSYAGLELSSS